MKNRRKCSQNNFLPKLTLNFFFGKIYPKNLGYFSHFQKIEQSQQLPKRRKIAQSSHPDYS
jgi:hypothetical protein